jgi:hypothetical protein
MSNHGQSARARRSIIPRALFLDGHEKDMLMVRRVVLSHHDDSLRAPRKVYHTFSSRTISNLSLYEVTLCASGDWRAAA